MASPKPDEKIISVGSLSKPSLPTGWVVLPSNSYVGKVYYFNTNTGDKTWECPQLIGTADSTSSAVNNSPSSTSTGSSYPKTFTKNTQPYKSQEKFSRPNKPKCTNRPQNQSLNPLKKEILKQSRVKYSDSGRKRSSSSEKHCVKKQAVSIEEREEKPLLSLSRNNPTDDLSSLSVPSSTSNSFKPQFSPHSPKFTQSTDPRISTELKAMSRSPIQSSSLISDSEAMDIEIPAESPVLESNDIEMTDVTVSRHIFPLLHKPLNCVENKNAYHLVVDTNVLIHNLGFVDELKDTPIEGCGPPVIVVPWVVFQELDSIKSQKNYCRPDHVKRKSITAIQYLHNKLLENHPRVKGQVENQQNPNHSNCNDDKILHCALQLSNIFKHVVMLTNDKNFANKSIVQGIPAHSAEEFFLYYKADLTTKNSTDLKANESFIAQCDMTPTKKITERSKVDDIVCKAKLLLKVQLEYFIETEMKKAYEDQWLTIVYLKPPWTLQDTLNLLLKHWISVFGFVLPKSIQSQIEKLKNELRISKGYIYKKEVAIELLTGALSLLVEVHKNNGHCKEELQNLKSLLVDLKALGNFEIKSSQERTYFAHSGSLKCGVDQGIISCLEYLWGFLNNLTGNLLDSLQQSHNFVCKRPEKPISKKDSLIFFPSLMKVLERITTKLKKVIPIEDFNSNDSKAKVKDFYREITQSLTNLKSKNKFPETFSLVELTQFLSNKDHKKLLSSSVKYLDELSEALNDYIFIIGPQVK